jgi:hypothetical protein
MRCKLIDAPKGGSTPGSDRYVALRYGPLVLCRNSETDPDYSQPVSVVADSDGFVAAKPETDAGDSLVFDIPTTSGCRLMQTLTAGTVRKSRHGCRCLSKGKSRERRGKITSFST